MSSALRTRRYAGSNPVRKANHQRVGESGRPYLPWKQGIVCSNHTTLTIVIDPWRNRNAAVCKTVMSRGGTGRVIQDKQIARLRKEITELFHVLVDRLDGQRISVRVQSSAPKSLNLSSLGSVGDRYFSVHTQTSRIAFLSEYVMVWFQVGDVRTSPLPSRAWVIG